MFRVRLQGWRSERARLRIISKSDLANKMQEDLRGLLRISLRIAIRDRDTANLHLDRCQARIKDERRNLRRVPAGLRG